MNERVCGAAVLLGLDVLYNEPLSKYTTMKTGGNASCIIRVSSAEALGETVRALVSENEGFFVLGKGSNVIAGDRGYSGTVLMLGDEMSNISVSGNDIICGGGASLIKVCRTALENSLTGLEFAYGIPGTVGGGVFMNAGAYGGEIKDIIVSAEAIDPVSGEIRTFSADEMAFSYRHSVFMENKFIIAKAVFRLKKGVRADIEAKMNELMDKRREKQPLEYPSAGSTFKRPEGSYASLLIEQCGLKGLSVGDAEVSAKHSGFIVNKGNASCHDIMELVKKVQDVVSEKTGYRLELEPVILGGN